MRRAHIDAAEALRRHTCLGRTLHHDTIELTVSVEIGSIQTAIVALQRGQDRLRRDAGLLTLGHIDVNHVLRIVRVVRSLGCLDLRTLVQLGQILLGDFEESVQTTTRTVLHDERHTAVGREAGNHRRCEGQHLSVLDGCRLLVDESEHRVSIVRIDEETVETVALPESGEFPPESLLALGEGLQLDDEGSLV